MHDFITEEQFGMFGLTETWLGTDIDKTVLRELLPPGYKIHHQPRLGKTGGVALIYKQNITEIFRSFGVCMQD